MNPVKKRRSGRVLTPAHMKPELANDTLVDAIVDAVDALSVADNDGDIREIVETLCEVIGMKSPYKEDWEEET